MSDLCEAEHPEQPLSCNRPMVSCYTEHAFVGWDTTAAETVTVTWPNPKTPPVKTKATKKAEMVNDVEPENKVGPPKAGPPPGHRDGETYEAEFDYDRLNAQAARVYDAIKDGEWYTLSEIEFKSGDPQASISARLRDLRKPEFGGLDVERRARVRELGVFEYRLNI